MKQIIEFTLCALLILMVIISALFSVATILATPLILAIIFSRWWLLIYAYYAVLAFTIYKFYVNNPFKGI
jgi:hypothetical protein